MNETVNNEALSKAISVDQLPDEVERLLRPAWEERESLMLERDGEPVAAVVPMDEYRRWHPETAKAQGEGRRAKGAGRRAKRTEEATVGPPAYELPADVLEAYHRLVNKKFAEGLTAEEEVELERVGKELDEADLATPLGQTTMRRAEDEHQRWMTTLGEVIEKLRTLRHSQ